MRTTTPLLTTLCVVSLVACGSEPDDGPDASTDASSDVSGDAVEDAGVDIADSGPDSDLPDIGVDSDDDSGNDANACTGSGPMCTFGCGGDVFDSPTCIGGAWVCPEGTTPIDDCPPGSCFGLPMPGEVCHNGWQCRPWETGALPACDADAEPVCMDCVGFEAGYSPEEGCECSCTDGIVECGPPSDFSCTIVSESTLDGVHIDIVQPDDCAFTLGEAAAGIPFAYDVVIDREVSGVASRAQDAGGCDVADVVGLALFERFAGGDQNWCICDEGLCAGVPPEPVTLTPSTERVTIVWHGRNFDGPSDTGFEERESFPPGDYTFSVTSVGTVDRGGDALPEPFEVRAELSFRLVE